MIQMKRGRSQEQRRDKRPSSLAALEIDGIARVIAAIELDNRIAHRTFRRLTKVAPAVSAVNPCGSPAVQLTIVPPACASRILPSWRGWPMQLMLPCAKIVM